MNTRENSISCAVVGVGHLGSIHARILDELPGSPLSCVVDTDENRAEEIGSKYNVPPFSNIREALETDLFDAAVVSVPTPQHFSVGSRCIQNGISVLIEKPMTDSLEDARKLVKQAEQKDVLLQVGHVERFNPAVRSLRKHLSTARFIECERLSPFRFRSAEIDVVQDVMIHDLDLVLSIVEGTVTEVDSVGTQVLTPRADIANTRLTFDNHCTVNLSASRISMDSTRKMRIFTPRAYYSLDFEAQELERFQPSDSFQNLSLDEIRELRNKDERNEVDVRDVFQQMISQEQLVSGEDAEKEPLKEELKAFLRALQGERSLVSSGKEGVETMELAERIRSDWHMGG